MIVVGNVVGDDDGLGDGRIVGLFTGKTGGAVKVGAMVGLEVTPAAVAYW